MSVLQVSLLGRFRLHHLGSSEEAKVTTNLQSLLAYLLLFRHRTHSRDTIIGLLWGDYDQHHARSCLNTALWRLRQLLEPEDLVEKGTYLLTDHDGEIGFNCASSYWLDVAEFEQRVTPILTRSLDTLDSTDLNQLQEGLQLYSGELLEGCYEDWALRERERCHDLYLSTLYCLMHYHRRQQNYTEGLECGRLILYSDPLREHVHRDMIRLYAESGQRAQAVQQYEACRQILASELGIEPMPETQDLYAQIVGDAHSAARGEDIDRELADLLVLFDEAHQRLHNLARHLHHPAH